MIDKEIDNISRKAFPKEDVAFEAMYWDKMNALLDQRAKKRGIIFWWGAGLAILGFAGGLWAFSPKTINETVAEKSINQSNTATVRQSTLNEKSETALNEINTPTEVNKSSATNQNEQESSENQNNEVLSIESPTSNELFSEPGSKDLNDGFEGKNTHKSEAAKNLSQVPLNYLIPFTTEKIPFLKKKERLYSRTADSLSGNYTTEFDEKVKSNSKLNYYIEPIVGYHQTFKKSSNNYETGTTSIDISYSPNYEWQFGGNIGAKLNNYYGHIGIHLNQLQGSIEVNKTTINTVKNELVESFDIVDKIDSTLIRTPVIKVPLGSDFVFQSGTPEYQVDTTYKTVYDTTTTEKQETESTSTSLNYKLQYVSIPLVIGYEFQLNKWYFGIGVGADFGFLVNSTGETYNNETQKIENISTSQIINETTFALNLQPAVGYYLSPKTSVIIRPNFRHQIISPFKESTKTKPRVGVLLGLRFQL